jgi:tripartite-type tricarboxylate transporter receptor subunit TctC
MGSFSLAVNASLYKGLPYDTLRDLSPISLVATTPYLLVVHPSMPVRSVQELVQLARAKPGMPTYASAGSGSGAHLSGELLRRLAHIDIVHVPYKGAAPATTDVLGGQVVMTFVNILQTLPLVHAGKLRALGVTTSKRSSIAPEIPAIAEGGVPGYELDGWVGILGPGGLPMDVVTTLQSAISDYLKSGEARKRFYALGVEPSGSTSEEFGRFLRAEVKKWGDIVRGADIKVR